LGVRPFSSTSATAADRNSSLYRDTPIFRFPLFFLVYGRLFLSVNSNGDAELIDRIEVHQAEKQSGEHVQKLTIRYACVGSMDIPDIDKLPEPEVRLQTRKGVAVNYG
jgi:hypothetical protein